VWCHAAHLGSFDDQEQMIRIDRLGKKVESSLPHRRHGIEVRAFALAEAAAAWRDLEQDGWSESL